MKVKLSFGSKVGSHFGCRVLESDIELINCVCFWMLRLHFGLIVDVVSWFDCQVWVGSLFKCQDLVRESWPSPKLDVDVVLDWTSGSGASLNVLSLVRVAVRSWVRFRGWILARSRYCLDLGVRVRVGFQFEFWVLSRGQVLNQVLGSGWILIWMSSFELEIGVNSRLGIGIRS